MAKAAQTPMMKQYLAFKKRHQDAVLLFRMGDFYETFFEDAKLCARVLGLTLTSRDKGTNPVPMAGFPHHAADGYIKRLIRAGHRVAICDQVQDPAEAKGLVERDVTRVMTAGTLTEEQILDSRANNFLAAVALDDKRAGLAWVDVSTGRFEVEEPPADALPDSLQRIAPAECLLAQTEGDAAHPALPHLPEGCMVTRRPPWEFARDEGRRRLLDHLGVQSLDGFGLEGMGPALAAAGALLGYLQETQRTALGYIRKVEAFHGERYLVLDATTRRSLELTETMRGTGQEGSLLHVLDRTATPMGARLLRRWVLMPLRERDAITQRLDAVEELVGNRALRRDLTAELEAIYDIERLTTKVYTGRANARDLVGLRRSLSHLGPLKDLLADVDSSLLEVLRDTLDPCPEVEGLIATAIKPDPPAVLTEGDLIQPGYSAELDELRQVGREGQSWIAEFESREADRTGIPSLKIGFNKVFGYYIEVTNVHRDKVPPDYTRKQTLKNAERYITPELKERESTVLGAGERARELEYELFQQVRAEVAGYTERMQRSAEALAAVDVLVALATAAAEARYVRPVITDGRELRIRDGRHPVLEQIMREEFVPNDVDLDGAAEGLAIITGPNMAGKSVYIRQAALIALMAHMGSFVPAREATDRPGRPHLHPRGRQRRAAARPEHVHGRDDRGGQHPEQRHRPQPHHPGRGRPRHQHLRRREHRLGGGRVHPRPRQRPHPLRHPLPRAGPARRHGVGRAEPERGRARVAGGGRLPAPRGAGRHGPQLRHPRGQAGRRAGRGAGPLPRDTDPPGGERRRPERQAPLRPGAPAEGQERPARAGDDADAALQAPRHQAARRTPLPRPRPHDPAGGPPAPQRDRGAPAPGRGRLTPAAAIPVTWSP